MRKQPGTVRSPRRRAKRGVSPKRPTVLVSSAEAPRPSSLPVQPMHFGSSDAPLFGVYHPPVLSSGLPVAAVLCYPLGIEYLVSHRSFRILAGRLARAGAHVLRFDYFGTGDSFGESTEGSIERWLSDVGAAVDELKAIAGVQEVHVLGLRFGGTLASIVARQRRDVRRLVLWDPVLDGRCYLDEMTLLPPRAGRSADEVMSTDGFPMSRLLREEIASLRLLPDSSELPREVSLITSSASPELDEFVASFTQLSRSVEHRVMPMDRRWQDVDDMGEALIPQGALKWIATRLAE